MVNIDPPEDLPSHWHTDFRSLYRECIQERYEEFDEDQYRERLEDHIKKEKEHRKLLNLSVFPFTNDPSPLGYKFIRADPLEELGVKNFDFLLWDFDGQAIFGEAKANIFQGAESLVNEVSDQIAVVEENLDYIVENYLGAEPKNIDFVLATFASDADDITRKIISLEEEIVTWGIHQMDKRISVNTILPRSSEIPEGEDIDDVRLRIMHSQHKLNSTLENAKTRGGSFDVFVESHPVAKYRALITAQYSERGYCFVNREDIEDIVEDDLFYLSEDRRDEVVEEVVQGAWDIGFIREYDDTDADFKLVSRYTNSTGLEKTLERKWIKSQIEEEIQGLKDECRKRATKVIGRQTAIDDFN